ncbi:MAG TPA: DUF1772 domain-containing protein [Candidatus Acidoferrum sp.]|jgi:hypothetical protein
MSGAIVEFTNLLVAALLVGAMFAVWLVFNPASLNAGTYVALHQHAVRTLDPALPVLGLATILVTIIAAVLGRADSTRFWLLIATAACFAASGLITRFLNMPINAIVMTWTGDSLPSNWMGLRNAWWRWHCLRLVTGLAGFSLLLTATLKHSSAR